MELLLRLYTNQFLVFVLVLTRVSGMMVLAPVWGSSAIPARVRAFLAIGISLIISPLMWHTPLDDPGSLLNLLVLVGYEFAVGLSLGLAVTIYFVALELAGQVMGQMSGMSLAEVVSPTFDTNVPVFSEFLNLLMLSIFVITGGHQYLLDALLQIFQQMPPGTAYIPASLMEALTDITTFSFTMGLRMAAPIMVALLLSLVITGLISRTLPQLNILAVGFSINSTVMLGALLVSLGVLAHVFQEQSFVTIDMIRPVFMHPTP